MHVSLPLSKPRQVYFLVVGGAALSLLAGCAARYQSALEDDLDATSRRYRALEAPPPLFVHGEPPAPFTPAPDFDGTFEAYLTHALGNSRELQAAFARWKSAVAEIGAARELPEPELTYGYFITGMEEHPDPVRHRVGLSQMFPWPTRITGAADAASARARAMQRSFDALALQLRQRIAEPYWRLWMLDQVRRIQTEQLTVLEAAAAAARARLEVGEASLADLTQIDLRAARTRDRISATHEEARMASATLAALLGLRLAEPLTAAPRFVPRPSLPNDPEEALITRALSHPEVEAAVLSSESATLRADNEGRARWPSLGLGFEYGPDMGGEGDATMLMVSMQLPVWWNVYGAAERAALAEGDAMRAEAALAADRGAAEVQASLAELRDAARRITLYQHTLLPQARAAYASVSAAFETGRSNIASVLMAQSDVLEIELDLIEAQRAHATSWARLEARVGGPLAAQEMQHAQ